MDLIAIVGIIAALITITSTVILVVRRIRRFMSAIDTRLGMVEDSLKLREELIVTKEFVVLNEDNDKLYTIPVGQTVIVYEVKNTIVDFVTEDRLIRGKTNIENFKQE